FILGGLLEDNLRRTLMLSQGDPSYFADRPLFLSLGLFTLALVCWPIGRFLFSQIRERSQP
ncbi:MAG: tripartite tricarboxylate transporter permease, partial [Betaproteobacteria bacterium]